MDQRVSLITPGVTDLNRSRAVYENGLHWQASSRSQDDILFDQRPGLVLALYPRHLLAEDATVPVREVCHNPHWPLGTDGTLTLPQA